eukprot:UN29112
MNDILSDLGYAFLSFDSVFYDCNIKTRDDLMSLTDSDLLNTIGFNVILVQQWRKQLPYTEGSWERLLYDKNYGKYVVKFEDLSVEELDDLQEYGDDDFEIYVGIRGPQLNKFKSRVFRGTVNSSEQIE